MSKSSHYLTIIGNLVKAPETARRDEYTVTTFSVACNSSRRGESPMYVRVSAWGKLGKTCMDCLEKGSMVYARGELRVTAFTGRDGTPKATIEITADDVEFLSRPAVFAEPKPVPAAAPVPDPTDPFGGFGDSPGDEPKAKAASSLQTFDLWSDDDLPWPQ